MKFSAKGLSGGLKLYQKTGQITGTLRSKGEFLVTLRAKIILGATEKKFRIVRVDQIALRKDIQGYKAGITYDSAVFSSLRRA